MSCVITRCFLVTDFNTVIITLLLNYSQPPASNARMNTLLYLPSSPNMSHLVEQFIVLCSAVSNSGGHLNCSSKLHPLAYTISARTA
jgi:hypothetical protein